MDSLRELVRILQRFAYFRRICGLSEVPHVSTFSRTSQWFQEQGGSEFHTQLLVDLGIQQPPIVLIDRTALRSSPYDSQARWGMSTRYCWFKGYKLHLDTTTEGIILSHVFTTANRHDAAVAPEVLSALQGWDIQFALGDAAYDSVEVRNIAENIGILFVFYVNPRNQKSERKDAYSRVIPDFLNTWFGKWLLGLRTNVERVFNQQNNHLGIGFVAIGCMFSCVYLCITLSFYCSFATPPK